MNAEEQHGNGLLGGFLIAIAVIHVGLPILLAILSIPTVYFVLGRTDIGFGELLSRLLVAGLLWVISGILPLVLVGIFLEGLTRWAAQAPKIEDLLGVLGIIAVGTGIVAGSWLAGGALADPLNPLIIHQPKVSVEVTRDSASARISISRAEYKTALCSNGTPALSGLSYIVIPMNHSNYESKKAKLEGGRVWFSARHSIYVSALKLLDRSTRSQYEEFEIPCPAEVPPAPKNESGAGFIVFQVPNSVLGEKHGLMLKVELQESRWSIHDRHGPALRHLGLIRFHVLLEKPVR